MLIFGSFLLGTGNYGEEADHSGNRRWNQSSDGRVSWRLLSGRSGWTLVDVKKYSGLRYSTLCVLSGEVFLNDFFRRRQWGAYFMVETDTCKKMTRDIRHPMASKQISMWFFSFEMKGLNLNRNKINELSPFSRNMVQSTKLHNFN